MITPSMPFNPLPPNNRPKKSRGSNCHTAALEAPCDMDFTLAPPAPISPCSQGALVPRPYPQVRKYVDRHSLSFNVPWSAFQARSRSRSVPVLIRMARHAIRRTTGQIHFLPANVSKVVLTVLMKSLPSRRSPSMCTAGFLPTACPRSTQTIGTTPRLLPPRHHTHNRTSPWKRM